MATIFILIGSILGFFGGLIVYIGFDATFWSALSIWLAAGPASALFVILAASLAPQQPEYLPIRAKVA